MKYCTGKSIFTAKDIAYLFPQFLALMSRCSVLIFKIEKNSLSHLIFIHAFTFDPRGRPTVTAGSDHYFSRVVYTSVRPSSLFKILQNKTKVQGGIVIATGRTVGLAEWIIDDTHFLFLIYLIDREESVNWRKKQ